MSFPKDYLLLLKGGVSCAGFLLCVEISRHSRQPPIVEGVAPVGLLNVVVAHSKARPTPFFGIAPALLIIDAKGRGLCARLPQNITLKRRVMGNGALPTGCFRAAQDAKPHRNLKRSGSDFQSDRRKRQRNKEARCARSIFMSSGRRFLLTSSAGAPTSARFISSEVVSSSGTSRRRL